MAQFQQGYFESMKNHFAQEKERQLRDSALRGNQQRKSNAKFIQIVKGVPMNVYTDSVGNVMDMEVCKDMDYGTRNTLYGMDTLVYEKYCSGAFKHATVDNTIKASVKGQPIDTALEVLQGLK